MRATSLGHAGILIECEAGSILCDPWFEPAFLGSWFVFPETTNSMLNYFIASNMLIISMCRTYTVTTMTRTGLRPHLRRDIPILLPDYQHLNNNAVRTTGFRNSSTLLMVRSRCYVTVSPLRFKTSITDGPGGDSAIMVSDGVHQSSIRTTAERTTLQLFVRTAPSTCTGCNTRELFGTRWCTN